VASTPRLILQLARRPRRQRAAEHPVAAGFPRHPRSLERERLAGARRGADDLDVVARAGQSPDELRLVFVERGTRLDRGRDVRGIGDRDSVVATPGRGRQPLALDREQLRCRVARFAGPPAWSTRTTALVASGSSANASASRTVMPSRCACAHAWMTSRRLKVLSSSVNSCSSAATCSRPITCRGSRGGPVSAGVRRGQGPARRRGRATRRGAGRSARSASRGGSRARHLRRLRRPTAMSIHVLDDLRAALGEVLNGFQRNPGEVGASLLNRTELDAEPPDQLRAQLGLVQDARGLRVARAQPPIQRRPAPVLAASGCRRRRGCVAVGRPPGDERCLNAAARNPSPWTC
jgi:hypothetical protein